VALQHLADGLTEKFLLLVEFEVKHVEVPPSWFGVAVG
jgi:hypothetical protein